MITLFRGTLLIPLIDNFKNNESILTSILLSLTITILDFADGAQARKCNTGTKLGHYLDGLFDFLSFMVIIFICIIKIFKIKKKTYFIINKKK